MKRTKPLQRTRWRTGGPDISREPKPTADREAAREQRAARSAVVRGGIKPTVAPLHRGVHSGATTGVAVAKSEPWRSQALRDMAQNRPCMFMVPGICNWRTDTTVLAHRNEGKGMATKQSDEMAAFGCAACHEWYDRSGAPREQKRQAFMEAHLRQVLYYRAVATDASESERFRKVAREALERLGATPVGEME